MTRSKNENLLMFTGLFASFLGFTNMSVASEYSQPLPSLSAEEKLEFRIGEGVFQKFWVPSPSSTTASDGLGPLYNTRSCNNCHVNNGRGHAPEAHVSGATIPSFMVRFGKRYPGSMQHHDGIFPSVGDAHYGGQLQGQSANGTLPEGDFHLTYQTHVEVLADGQQVSLRKPILHWDKLHYGPFEADTGVTLLNTPSLVGMGLLDNIPDPYIIANADPDDLDQDGISGKVSWIPGQHNPVVGRFGYKASTPSVTAQNQLAFNTDLGLSTLLFPAPSGDCTPLQLECLNSPNGNSPHLDNLEVDKQQSRLVDLFVSLAAPPAMRNLSEPDFLAGKDIFIDSGCASCHTPKMVTGNDSPYSVLKNRTFYPFTDMLLHDMGAELRSGFPVYSAEPQEWRTAPLWGIGLSEKVSGRVGFLHDGRARTIEEAILWHGGEAQSSQQAYKRLSKEYRQKLIYFLESL
ncbi:di-heme oxidoredictase family protein [Marinomonas posidonica]|uniref:di-heme oxidoreductase family protein n=1 Tax=Marinomonas posidonica TaxID=936476 RepID=UPI0037356C60